VRSQGAVYLNPYTPTLAFLTVILCRLPMEDEITEVVHKMQCPGQFKGLLTRSIQSHDGKWA
jgi:hypothetical protein